MPHISFSEIKYWNKCPFYHKLVYVDKLKGFEGNEHTAFGSAIHSTCEKLLVENNFEPLGYFKEQFLEELLKVPNRENFNRKLISDMKGQGESLLPDILEATKEYFGEYEVSSVEEKLFEPIKEFLQEEYNFKGYIDIVFKTKDGKYHIVDWKTCSWGWDARRRSDPMTTYQLTLYKHFFALKNNIDPKNIETHFALLKRTAKQNKIEFFKVTSGPIKTENALKLSLKALYNIHSKNYPKNRLSCRNCEFYKTEHCP